MYISASSHWIRAESIVPFVSLPAQAIVEQSDACARDLYLQRRGEEEGKGGENRGVKVWRREWSAVEKIEKARREGV